MLLLTHYEIEKCKVLNVKLLIFCPCFIALYRVQNCNNPCFKAERYTQTCAQGVLNNLICFKSLSDYCINTV